jgi:hypothetical protein
MRDSVGSIWVISFIYDVVLFRDVASVPGFAEIGWPGKTVALLVVAVSLFLFRLLPFLAVYRGASVPFEVQPVQGEQENAQGCTKEIGNG